MNLYPKINDQIADILLLGNENENQAYHYAGHYINQLREENAILKRALVLACGEIAIRKVRHVSKIGDEAVKIATDIIKQAKEEQK